MEHDKRKPSSYIFNARGRSLNYFRQPKAVFFKAYDITKVGSRCRGIMPCPGCPAAASQHACVLLHHSARLRCGRYSVSFVLMCCKPPRLSLVQRHSGAPGLQSVPGCAYK